MSKDWFDFGEYIKFLRARDHLTQAQLANLISKSPSEICRWERGNRRPKQPNLLKLSTIFGIPIQILQQKAGYTPEFDWQVSFIAPKHEKEDILSTASESEKSELREYLRYLRFKTRILNVEYSDELIK